MPDLIKSALQLQAIEAFFYSYRAFTAKPDEMLARRGLSRVHHRILFFIARKPGLSVSQLLAALGVTKQALNTPLRQLVEMHLIRSEAADSDKRKRLLELTPEGSKLETIGHHPYVAFEVDEVRGIFDWRSVVAHGTVYLLEPESGATAAAEYAHALELMRRFMPETLKPGDPVPFRTVLFGIHVDELRGREAGPGKRRRAPREKSAK